MTRSSREIWFPVSELTEYGTSLTSVPRSPSWPEITRAEADTTGISPEVAQAESASSYIRRSM